MIDIALKMFYAAFRPCGCLSTCVNADFEGAEDMRTEWEKNGLTVKSLRGHELVSMPWTCPIYRAKQHRLNAYDMGSRE